MLMDNHSFENMNLKLDPQTQEEAIKILIRYEETREKLKAIKESPEFWTCIAKSGNKSYAIAGEYAISVLQDFIVLEICTSCKGEKAFLCPDCDGGTKDFHPCNTCGGDGWFTCTACLLL